MAAQLAVAPLHRLKIHSRAVSMSKFRMLTRGFPVASSGYSLNNIPPVPKLRLPLLRRHFVGFSRSTFDFVSNLHCFERAAVFLHALMVMWCFIYLPAQPANCFFLWFSLVMLCGSIFRAVWIEGFRLTCCYPFCHCKLLRRFIMRHFVDDLELGEVSVSVLTVQLRCTFVYLCTFFLILKWFLCWLIVVWRMQHEISTTPEEIEHPLRLILVKQSVTQCTDIR